MKRTLARKRPRRVAVALGAVLVTAGCASTSPQNAGAPVEQASRNDGGVEQLLLYCGKLQDKGELVTAASICERAHILAPDDPKPLLMMGDIFTKMDRLPQAVAAYQTILEKTPHHAEARYLLGKTYVSMGRYDLALQELEFSRTQNPNDVRVYNALGIANSMLGNQDAAREAFESGLKVAPQDIPLRNNLGLALVLSGRSAEGLAILQQAAADPAANATSIRNLRLAEKIAQSADAGQAVAAATPESTPATPAESEQIASAAAEPEFSATAKPADQPAAVAAEPLAADSAPAGTGPQPVPREPVMLAGAMQTAQNDMGLSTGDMPVYLDSDSSNTGSNATAGTETDQTESESAAGETDNGATEQNADSAADETAGDVATFAMPQPALGATADTPPNTAPVPTATMQPAVTANATMAPQAATAPKTMQTASLTGALNGDEIYSVQLAAFRSPERAQDGWQKIRAKALDLLEKIEPVIRRSDLGADRGVFYRLRTKPTSKDAANQLCTALQSRGISCLTIKESPAAAENANTSPAAKS